VGRIEVGDKSSPVWLPSDGAEGDGVMVGAAEPNVNTDEDVAEEEVAEEEEETLALGVLAVAAGDTGCCMWMPSMVARPDASTAGEMGMTMPVCGAEGVRGGETCGSGCYIQTMNFCDRTWTVFESNMLL